MAEKSTLSELKPWPSFIEERIALWEKLKNNYEEDIASKIKESIKVTLPDGKEVDGTSWETSPYKVAQGIRYTIYYSRKFLILSGVYNSTKIPV